MRVTPLVHRTSFVLVTGALLAGALQSDTGIASAAEPAQARGSSGKAVQRFELREVPGHANVRFVVAVRRGAPGATIRLARGADTLSGATLRGVTPAVLLVPADVEEFSVLTARPASTLQLVAPGGLKVAKHDARQVVGWRMTMRRGAEGFVAVSGAHRVASEMASRPE